LPGAVSKAGAYVVRRKTRRRHLAVSAPVPIATIQDEAPSQTGKNFMMHSQEISADFDTLLRQSSMTSETYMREAVENIDKMFGKGHAKAHPDLLIAFMQASSSADWFG
jgi:hypothetical protein